MPPMERDFAAGDKIKIELDPDVWKLMQEGHGGWNDLMTMVGVSRDRSMTDHPLKFYRNHKATYYYY